MRVYLAGPMGFTDEGRHYKDAVVLPALRRAGAEVTDPWTLVDAAEVASMPPGESRLAAWKTLNQAIGRANAAAIEACDLVVASLDGSDVDSGTAAEIGFAFARGKTIIGYRTDLRLSCDNEGCSVNLQVEYFIHASGGRVLRSLAEVIKAIGKARGVAPGPHQRQGL